MTVNTNIPYNSLLGDGSITTFPFTWGFVETTDLYIFVDSVLQVEYSTYTLENLTDEGGEVEFVDPPESGAVVLILRKTNITQQLDYVSGDPFQAETHEFGMDKLIYILQELIKGAYYGLDSDGNEVVLTFDLSVTQNVTTVTINNSGGTDAEIPAWTDAEYAGVFHGELTDAAPADESATTKPDGYVWIEY